MGRLINNIYFPKGVPGWVQELLGARLDRRGPSVVLLSIDKYLEIRRVSLPYDDDGCINPILQYEGVLLVPTTAPIEDAVSLFDVRKEGFMKEEFSCLSQD